MQTSYQGLAIRCQTGRDPGGGGVGKKTREITGTRAIQGTMGENGEGAIKQTGGIKC